MHVPRALERENAGYRSVQVQASRNGVRLGFQMLRLTVRCCGRMDVFRAHEPVAAWHMDCKATCHDLL